MRLMHEDCEDILLLGAYFRDRFPTRFLWRLAHGHADDNRDRRHASRSDASKAVLKLEIVLTPLRYRAIIMIATRGGAVAARRAHNPKVVGSNPTPATNSNNKALS